MRIQFLGAAGTVTGSCFLVETKSHSFLVDCGMFQGGKAIKERNYQPFLFEPDKIDFLLLTHAHIDHSGLIPKLYRFGYRGPIYCTDPTVDLCAVLLPDSAHIQEMEVERKNRKRCRAGQPVIQPIYTVEDAEACMKLFKRVEYNETLNFGEELVVRFQDAGHILGSAIIEVWSKEECFETKLVFSGDLGNLNRPLMKDPAVLEYADYLFLESTYGSRLHQYDKNTDDKLRDIIIRTLDRGGNVIIPAFAVARTQDLIYGLNNLVHSKQIPPVPIIIDSPLAIRATEIFRRHIDEMDSETLELIRQGQNPLEVPGLKFSLTSEESKSLNNLKSGAIIISASGMADAGRIKHHLKHNLWRPESSIVFVGYQAAGTLGRYILDGAKVVTIHGEEVAVKAEICNLEGFSGHADQAGLINWVKNFKIGPGKIFLVHGEPESSTELGELIGQETRVPTYIPAWREVVELPPFAHLKGGEAAKEAAASLETAPLPRPVRTPTEEDLAIEAELSYFKLRMKLREMVEKDMDSRQYGDLIKKLKELDENLNFLSKKY